MTTPANQPFRTISADELERFTTRHRREILFYLHQLINDGERIGCRFINLSHAMETKLQRFITHVQREERSRLGS